MPCRSSTTVGAKPVGGLTIPAAVCISAPAPRGCPQCASPTSGAHPNRRQAEHTTTSRLLGDSPTTGAKQPTGKAQYRTAGRVLQARSEGSGLGSSTRAASAARRVPAKRDCAVKKMVPGTGLEPAHREVTDFKSVASAYSATLAYFVISFI